MTMAESLEGRVRLGGFEINLRSGELWPVGAVNGDGKLLLREQPFQVLRMLIDRGGKMVTREEIRKKLWPNDTVVDFDHGINMAIGFSGERWVIRLIALSTSRRWRGEAIACW